MKMSKEHEEVKEYLNKVKVLKKRIKSMERRLEYLENESISSPDISGMPHNPNRKNSVTESSVMRIMDFRDKIQNEKDNLEKTKEEIKNAIDAVGDSDLVDLLTFRYLSDMMWRDIAVKLEYSIDNIYFMHRKALDMIQLPKKEKTDEKQSDDDKKSDEKSYSSEM